MPVVVMAVSIAVAMAVPTIVCLSLWCGDRHPREGYQGYEKDFHDSIPLFARSSFDGEKERCIQVTESAPERSRTCLENSIAVRARFLEALCWNRAMNLVDDFRHWVADSARTVNELCAAEVLLEIGEGIWKGKNRQPDVNWDAKARKRKERAGNPAYRPSINQKALDRTIEVAPILKHFTATWHDDRPIRSLAPLRFFPEIQDVSATAEVTDFSSLHALPALKRLNLTEPHADGGHVMRDFNGLAGLKIQSLSLAVRTPWPDLRSLGQLSELETLTVRANILAFRDVGPLARVKTANFEPEFHCNTPARNFRDLPAMPSIVHLRVNSIADLAGVEDFQGLLGLDLVGPFQDLTPLEKLESVTWLRLEGNWFSDLTPIARMPRLRELILVRERPLDLSPLADAPHLREVTVERCAILRTELSALNAGLVPWGLDFVAPEPRPLVPVRAFTYRPQDPEVAEALKQTEPDARAGMYGEDLHYAAAEARWFGYELQQRLDTLLGAGWGDVTSYPDRHPGYRHLPIQRFKDIVRFDEIIEVTRSLMATSRFHWQILVSAEPHGDLSKDMEEIRAQREEQERDWLDRDYDAEQEREEYEEFRQMRKELYERLEREHRLRLLQQQGEEINPADFSPASKPAASKPASAEAEEGDDEWEEDEDQDLDPSEFEEEMSFGFYLTENHIWVTEHDRETFESTLGIRAEDWHALPQPPTERPRPRGD